MSQNGSKVRKGVVCQLINERLITDQRVMKVVIRKLEIDQRRMKAAIMVQ